MNKNIVFLIAISMAFGGCRSLELEKFSLLELQPLPEVEEQEEVVEVKTEVDDEKESVYVTSGIAEIEVVSGVQRFLYLRIGSEQKGISPEAEGIIYSDASKSEEIGRCSLVEIYSGFSKAQITDLSFKISIDAVVSFQVE